MRSGCIGRAPVTSRGRRFGERSREHDGRVLLPGGAVRAGERDPDRLRAAGRGVVGHRQRVRQIRHLPVGQAQQHRALGRRVAGLGGGGRGHVQHERAGGENVGLGLVGIEHVARHDVDPVAGVDVARHAGVRVDGQAERALVAREPCGDTGLVADAGPAGRELVAVEDGLGEDEAAGRVQIGVGAGHEIGATDGPVGEVAVGRGRVHRAAGVDVVRDDDDADGVAGRLGRVLHMLGVEHERHGRREREDDRDDDVSAQRRRCHFGCSFPACREGGDDTTRGGRHHRIWGVVQWDSSAPVGQSFKPEPGSPAGVRDTRPPRTATSSRGSGEIASASSFWKAHWPAD